TVSPSPAPSVAVPASSSCQLHLQTLLLTTETLTVEKLPKLVSDFPGVHGCVLSTMGSIPHAGEVRSGFEVVVFHAHAIACKMAMEPLKLGAVRALTVHG